MRFDSILGRFRQSFLAGASVLTLLAGAPAHAADAKDASGADTRIQRIEKLLGDIRVELDSLKRESADLEAKARHAGEGPILGELMSDRQRLLARVNQTAYRQSAAGYSFDRDLPMGLHYLHWQGSWGVKLEGGAIITDETRVAGLSAKGLYGIHRFQSLDLIETHLYGFVGGGYLWERVLFASHIDEPWYETPDRRLTGKLGVGTELSFYNLGGIRLSPEVGLQLDRYLTRHEDSPSYNFTVPESRVFLEPFFALHASFYFR